ncbi:MAG: hypothetical protein ACRBCK_10100 [Alphaproteobacteria bacterium]
MNNLRAQLDAAYEKKVIGTAVEKAKKVALIVDRHLVFNTPVDRGRARLGWMHTLDTIPTSEGEGEDLSTVLSAYKIHNTIYITNNVPYIKPLNEGHSSQSPEGFVDGAIQVGKDSIRR